MSESPFAQGDRAGLHLLADLKAGVVETPEIISTGIMPIDHFTRGGLRIGEVSVIGASTGHGKSALAEQIALDVSKRHRTTFFALEMGHRRTEVRMLSKLLRLDQESVWNLMATNAQHERLREAVEDLCYGRMLIVEERSAVEEFRANHMFAMVIANRPKLIVIDHPRHLDDWRGAGGQRTDLASEALVRRFAACARAMDAHVMVVCQTRRDMMGKRPTMQDLADSYALPQAADLVVMLHRPFRARGAMDNVAELILDKNRNGPEGIAHMRWHGPTMRYTDLTPDEESALECCKRAKARNPETDDAELGEPPF